MRALLHHRLDTAIDFGYILPDHHPVFGESKTWRGFFGGIIVTAIAAMALGYGAGAGVLIAVYALVGDLFSSFIKRRFGMAPSSMAPLLDQVPESLLPALMMMDRFDLDMQSIIIIVCSFFVLELLLSYIFFRLGIRKRPY